MSNRVTCLSCACKYFVKNPENPLCPKCHTPFFKIIKKKEATDEITSLPGLPNLDFIEGEDEEIEKVLAGVDEEIGPMDDEDKIDFDDEDWPKKVAEEI